MAQSKRLFLADESLSIRRVLDIALDQSCTAVESVQSFEEAMKLQDMSPPDVWMVSAGLTGLSRAEDLLKFATVEDPMRVVILLGSFDSFKKHDLMKVGLKHFLEKPFTRSNLLSCLERVGVTAEPFEQAIPRQVVQAGQKATRAALSDPDLPPQQEGLEADASPPKLRSERSLVTQASYQPRWENDQEFLKRISGRLEELVKRYVHEYCEEHFDDLARQIVETELRKLSEARQRLLIDA